MCSPPQQMFSEHPVIRCKWQRLRTGTQRLMPCNAPCWPYRITAYTELTLLYMTLLFIQTSSENTILTLTNITKQCSAFPNIDVTKIHTIFVHTISALTKYILQYAQNWDIFSHSCAPWTLTLLHHLHCCENLGIHRKYVKWKYINFISTQPREVCWCVLINMQHSFLYSRL